jgi:hypothetical protein
MSEMIERVARAMYLNRVAPDSGPVVLSVASMGWEDLLEEHSPGHQIWHCRGFWRQAARAAIEAMRTPTDGQRNAYYDLSFKTETMFDAHWERAIDAALSEKP